MTFQKSIDVARRSSTPFSENDERFRPEAVVRPCANVRACAPLDRLDASCRSFGDDGAIRRVAANCTPSILFSNAVRSSQRLDLLLGGLGQQTKELVCVSVADRLPNQDVGRLDRLSIVDPIPVV